MKKKSNRIMMAGFTGLALLLSACGGSDDEGAITVSLSEWEVDAPATVSAGMVTITAINDGGETHELVLVRADSADGFEQDETGKVDEDQFAEGDFIGEITEFDAGTTKTQTFDLAAGTYVLFCNIIEEEADGTFESHFVEGMVTTIVVE